MDNNESKRVIEIPAQGSWVWKFELRAIIGVSPRGWSEEIKLIKEKNPSFETEYNQYKNYRRVPTNIARIIIEHVYSAMGEEVEIKFAINTSDVNN